MNNLIIIILTAPYLVFSKPFWTEKTSYVEGDRLYAVGTSRVYSEEAKARQEALENAKVEIQNYFQVSDISNLEVTTQMHFEQPLKGGQKSYRLVWVDLYKGLEIKKEALAKNQELITIKNKDISAIKENQKIEVNNLEAKIKELDDLEARSKVLTETWKKRKKFARNAATALDQKIKERSSLVCLVKVGMSKDEVLSLLGTPDSDQPPGVIDGFTKIEHTGNLKYGNSSINYGKGNRHNNVNSTFTSEECD